MATRMQQRRGTAAQWTAANPVLAAGEIGFETDTNQFKMGDGSTAWSSLSFFKNLEDLGGLDDFVTYTEIGAANDPADYTRTAPLNSDGLIPLAYMAKLVEGSDANLDTFAELGSAIDQLNEHAEATAGIHGISDTADLAYVTDPRFSDERTPEDLSVVTGKIAESAVTSSKIADNAVGTVKIADSAVTTSKINNGDVTAAKLGTDSVTSIKIQNDAVTTDKIQNDAVTSAKIISGAVGPAELASYAVETAKIDDLAVTEAKIADDAITSSKIADESVTGSKIADNSISQSHLTDDSVGTNEIGGLAVTTGKIADLAVSTGKIADLAVTTGKLDDLSVTTGKIDDLAVTSEKIADASVGTDQLVDANVTEAKLANDSVTSSKLADNAVETAHITNANVTEAKLATGSVTTAKIADAAVTSVKVLDGSIGSSKLAVDAVETAKIADSAVTSAKIADGTIVNGDINASAAIAQSKIAGLSDSFALKADLAGPTFTGTVSGITKSMVGLGNVDNTTDAGKPVSTATQTALNLKANLNEPTFTGTVTSTNDVVVNGNLTVNGTTFNASSTSITIEDNLVQLAHQNAANTVDLGIVVGYNDGSAKHAGLVRDVSDSKWKLFKGVTTEPSTTVDFTQGSLDDLKVAALEATTVTPSSGIVFSDGTQVKAGVPSITAFATEITSSATLAAGEADKFVPLNGAVVITLPATGYSTGQSIDFWQSTGTGASFASTNGVVGTPGRNFRTTNSVVTAMKTATGWLIFGDLSA